MLINSLQIQLFIVHDILLNSTQSVWRKSNEFLCGTRWKTTEENHVIHCPQLIPSCTVKALHSLNVVTFVISMLL